MFLYVYKLFEALRDAAYVAYGSTTVPDVAEAVESVACVTEDSEELRIVLDTDELETVLEMVELRVVSVTVVDALATISPRRSACAKPTIKTSAKAHGAEKSVSFILKDDGTVTTERNIVTRNNKITRFKGIRADRSA
jgi:hypothetical protein